jgi:FG-GAP repeat protein
MRGFVASCVVVSLVAFASAGGTLLVEHTTAHPGQFGWNVSAVGDVSRDGVSDYAVGARGSAYVTVYSGADRSFLYEFQGTGFFGWSIAPYADVDGDGRVDFLVGAPTLAGPEAEPGHVRVCSGLDGSEIRRVTGTSASERFGASVAAVGDVDDDGVPDFAVGAPGGTGIAAGAVHVYSGQDGTEIVALRKSGSTFRDNLGSSVVGLGDVNHDGIPDFAVGAPGADPRNTGVGITYGRVLWISGRDGAVLRTVNGTKLAVFGETIAACGDQDRDGVTDLLVGARGVKGATGQASIWSSRTGRRLFSVNGISPKGFFGIGVAGLDDFDGDGRAEIAVGAELDGSGEVAVISPGRKKLYFLHRGAAGDLVGDFLARAGDLDGDGKSELLVGAWGADAARVFKIDTNPLPLPAPFRATVKLVATDASSPDAKGSFKLKVRRAVLSATVAASSLPVGVGAYSVHLEDGVGAGTYSSIGFLTVTDSGRGTLTLAAQYLPPPQLHVATFAELTGRRVEIRRGATVVLAGTVP